jgi:hypothetical protein
VPVVLLQGQDNVRLLYLAPGRGVRVAVRVEATSSVDVYALPEQALEDFDEERPFDSYWASLKRRNHRFRFSPKVREQWYLVIESRSDGPTSVFYEVAW